MKVVDWKEFAEMPDGTIFCFLRDQRSHSGLLRKGETIAGDDGPVDFSFCELGPAQPDGASWKLDEDESRWGMYEYDRRFIVYELADVQKLLELLAGQSVYVVPDSAELRKAVEDLLASPLLSGGQIISTSQLITSVEPENPQ